jgi:hypothetical protein
MSAGYHPDTSRVRLGPRIGLPILPPIIDVFSPEMVIGSQPSRSRVLYGTQKSQTLSQTTHTDAPFGSEMVVGHHPDTGRALLGARIPQPILPPTIEVFSIEMAVGHHPDTHRVKLGPRIPLPVSQTTQTNAPFGPEMVAGWHPDRSRVLLGARIPLPVLPPTIDLFSVDMVIGSRPDTNRVRYGNQKGATLSQTTHVSAPFSVEMAIGWAPYRLRGQLGPRIPLPVGETLTITQQPLVADACNTFTVPADMQLTVAADDTSFTVAAEDQSFDVEGCE